MTQQHEQITDQDVDALVAYISSLADDLRTMPAWPEHTPCIRSAREHGPCVCPGCLEEGQ